MHTNRTQSIAWRVGSLAGFAAALGSALLLSGGCSPQSAAAGAVAAAAANAVAQATTAPSTATATNAAVQTAAVATSSGKSLVGRWVIQRPVAYPDGTPAPDAVYVLVFNKDGSYETSGKVGYNPLVYFRGTYQALGNALTTHIGKATAHFTFKVQGSDLILVDNVNKQSKTYHRG